MLEEGEIEEGEISDDDNWSVKPPENPPLNPLKPPENAEPAAAQHALSSYRKALELVSSVTAQSACNSLAGTCLQLYDALVILGELPPGVKLPGEASVSSLVSQIFGKIRVLFHLYDAVPQEIKLRAFANLTKLSSLFKESLFTSSQSQELNNLAQAIKPEQDEPKNSIKPVHQSKELREVDSKKTIKEPQVDSKKTIKELQAEPKKTIKEPQVEPKKTIKEPQVEPKKTIKEPQVEPKKTIKEPQVEPKKAIKEAQLEPKKTIKEPLHETKAAITKPAQENIVKRPPVPAYVPWENRQDDITHSYSAYVSSFRMDDIPSPTPSEEDEAARYGKKSATAPVPTVQVSQPQPTVTLKSRDPRKSLISGVTLNLGKPRVASILRKREAAENTFPDLKRQKLNPEAPKPAIALSGSGGWLDLDSGEPNNTEEPPANVNAAKTIVMKARDPRRALIENSITRPLGVPVTQPNPAQETDLTAAAVPAGANNQLEVQIQEASADDLEDASLHPELQVILNGLDEAGRAAFLEERRRRMDEHEKMISQKKLCLVLDLDHTLLNSAKFSEVGPECEQFLRTAEVMERSRDRKELYRFPHMAMWTKLRPGIWRFLARASELYEMHLYTMGNKAYATEMAKLLDPTGVMFSGRVISKGDDGVAVYGDEKLPKSKDMDGVLGMESAAIIIDDSSRVWPHHRDNLIVVERYMYFPSSRRQFGLLGPSLLEVGHDEREADGMLASVLGVIERIHFDLFMQPRPKEMDAREILALQQRRILQGCKIVFSRIIPVGEMQPQLHPLWRSAEQFGAVCTTVLEPDVTHIVALSLGTDKANWALSTGKHLVRPGWIEASTILYRRANERDFLVSA